MCEHNRASRVAAIRAQLAVATGGTWTVDDVPGFGLFIKAYVEESIDRVAQVLSNRRHADADAALIANAPADLAWLVARVGVLEAALEAFRDPEFGLMISPKDPVTVSIDGKNYQCVMSACFFCRAKAAWAKDIQHADDCPIRVVRVALEGAGQ